MRMDLARQLLARSGLTVAAIGERCGYPECHHFAARFKAHHGMAPGAWRRRTAAGAAGG
jgi:AraC-like DNA-binding protein